MRLAFLANCFDSKGYCRHVSKSVFYKASSLHLPDGLSSSVLGLGLFDGSTKSSFRLANGLLGLFDSQSRLIFDTLPTMFSGKSRGRLLY